MATDISKLGVKATWEELTEGMIVAGAGTSKEFNTGEWSQLMLIGPESARFTRASANGSLLDAAIYNSSHI